MLCSEFLKISQGLSMVINGTYFTQKETESTPLLLSCEDKDTIFHKELKNLHQLKTNI